MDILEILDKFQKEAQQNKQLRDKLLETGQQKNSLEAFCKIARAHGYAIYEMDLVDAGERFYAAMRRSTNGGGENSPMLDGEDDFYELFLASLKSLS